MSVKGFKGLSEAYDYSAIENAPNITGMINAGVSSIMNSVVSMVNGNTVSGKIAHGLVYPKSGDNISVYSASATYSEGDLVLYGTDANQRLYRANQDIATAEAWTSGHWEQISVFTLINDLITRVEALEGR